MNRQFRRIQILWKNTRDDLGRSFRRTRHRAGESVRTSFRSARTTLGDIPGGAGSTIGRALRKIPEFFRSLGRAIIRIPSAIRSLFGNLARTRRGVADTVKSTVKGAQVTAQEQPEELRRGIAARGRQLRTFIWDRPVWARIILVSALIGLVSAPFTARPVYRQLIAWRAEGLAHRAEQMAADGREKEAFDTAQAAFLLNRHNPIVADTVARRAQAIDHPQALDYLSIAIERPEPSPEIIALFVAESIRHGDLAKARPYLSWLQRTNSGSASTVALNIRYFMAEGQREDALKEVREAVTVHPADTEILSLYASLTINETSTETSDEGLRYLRAQSDQETVYGQTALRILLANDLISASERAEYAQRLLAHPLALRDDKLLAFSSLLASGATSFAEIRPQIHALFDSTDSADLRDLGHWLLLNGLPTEALTLLPEARAKTNKEFFQIYLTAMLESGHGQEILDLLSSGEPVPLSPVERLIDLAGIQKILGLDDSFETAAGLAISRAEVRDFSYLQRAIEYFHNDILMLDFFRRVSRDPRFALLGKSRLFALAYEMNRTDIVESLMGELQLRDLRPYPLSQNVLAYVKLLLGEEIDEARSIAENLVARFPSIIDYRVTLALAYLRSSDVAAAREVLSPRLAQREGFRNGWKVVIVAMLIAQDETDRAHELLSSINRETLSAPERAFLEESGL